MVSHGLSWFVMVCHGLSWFLMVSHGLSWFVMVCHGLSWFVPGVGGGGGGGLLKYAAMRDQGNSIHNLNAWGTNVSGQP